MEDVKGFENESDIIEGVGYEAFAKIKSILNVNSNTYLANSRASFKGVDLRIIGCNGDCGSPISKFIDYCVCQKVCCNDALSRSVIGNHMLF